MARRVRQLKMALLLRLVPYKLGVEAANRSIREFQSLTRLRDSCLLMQARADAAMPKRLRVMMSLGVKETVVRLLHHFTPCRQVRP